MANSSSALINFSIPHQAFSCIICFTTSKHSSPSLIPEPRNYPDITICPFPAYDTSVLKTQFGYHSSFDFSRGIGPNREFVGWVANGSHQPDDIVKTVSTFKEIKDCPPSNVYFGKHGSVRRTLSFTLTQTIHPSGRCCQALVPDIAANLTISGIMVKVTNLTQMDSFKMFLSGRKSATYFQKNKFNINGAYLTSTVNKPGYMLFRAKTLEEVSLEDDPHFQCSNYPREGQYAKVK